MLPAAISREFEAGMKAFLRTTFTPSIQTTDNATHVARARWNEVRAPQFGTVIDTVLPTGPIEREIIYNVPFTKGGREPIMQRYGANWMRNGWGNTAYGQAYPSIYTHALDWAIQGKKKAKARLRVRGNPHLGTKIDKLVQAGQEGQTRGIPIGPDTSILLSHILLGAVDKRLESNGFATGSRFVDDYELVFETRSDAERALAALEESLTEFELELNPEKTSIAELPIPIEDEAIEELRKFPIRPGSAGQRFDIIHYFNRAFALSKEKRDRPILRYAVGRIRRLKVAKGCYELLEELILQAVSVEPGVWPKAIPTFQHLRKKEPSLSLEPLERVINMVVRQQAPRGHSSEVAWSLWAAIVFGVKLEAKAVKTVMEMADDVCGLLLLHANSLKLITPAPKTAKLSAFLTTPELRGQHWLLAYEGEKKGWLTPISGHGIAHDPAFDFLSKKGVEFYDASVLTASVPKPSTLPAVSVPAPPVPLPLPPVPSTVPAPPVLAPTRPTPVAKPKTAAGADIEDLYEFEEEELVDGEESDEFDYNG